MNEYSKSWLVGAGAGFLLGLMCGVALMIRYYG